MTTTEAPSTDQLQSQLTEAREQVEAAEMRLGAARLDRKGETAAAKELERATTEVQRIEAAITVATQRADAEAQKAADDQARAERLAWYGKAAAYLPKLVEVLEKRAELAQMITEIAAMPMPTTGLRPREDLDYGLIRHIPLLSPINGSHNPLEQVFSRLGEMGSVEELITRVHELIEAEHEGRNIAETKEDVNRRRRERRIAFEAERKAEAEQRQTEATERKQAKEAAAAGQRERQRRARRVELDDQVEGRVALLRDPLSGHVERVVG